MGKETVADLKKTVSELSEIIKVLREEIATLKKEKEQTQKPEITDKQNTPKFIAKQIRSDCDTIIIGTSRVKHMKVQDFATTTAIHSYRGATLVDLLDVVTQYPAQHISNVFLIAGFNDKDKSKEIVEERFTKVIELLNTKFSPKKLIVPDTISAADEHLADQVVAVNEALVKATEGVSSPIERPNINAAMGSGTKLSEMFFQRDKYHLSYTGVALLTCVVKGFIDASSRIPSNHGRSAAAQNHHQHRQHPYPQQQTYNYTRPAMSYPPFPPQHSYNYNPNYYYR